VNRHWTFFRERLWRDGEFIVRWNKLILFIKVEFLRQVQA
jgi:hypothetical protein